MSKVNVIKTVVQVRPALEAANLGERCVRVSMFTVEGKQDTFIGLVRGDKWSPYHSGQRRYIERVWKNKFAK